MHDNKPGFWDFDARDRGAWMSLGSTMMLTEADDAPRRSLRPCETRRLQCFAPAGGGKTFVAIQRVVEVLHEARCDLVQWVDKALSPPRSKWPCCGISSRPNTSLIAHVLVARLEDDAASTPSPTTANVGDSRADAPTYALIVVDEAHHLVGRALSNELAELSCRRACSSATLRRLQLQ